MEFRVHALLRTQGTHVKNSKKRSWSSSAKAVTGHNFFIHHNIQFRQNSLFTENVPQAPSPLQTCPKCHTPLSLLHTTPPPSSKNIPTETRPQNSSLARLSRVVGTACAMVRPPRSPLSAHCMNHRLYLYASEKGGRHRERVAAQVLLSYHGSTHRVRCSHGISLK